MIDKGSGIVETPPKWYLDFWNRIRNLFLGVGTAIVISNLIVAGSVLFLAYLMLKAQR